MKKVYLSAIFFAFLGMTSFGQLTPRLSLASKTEQKVGFTDISVSYSRPSKLDREIFGGLVPFNEIWRTGANENSTITTSEVLIFGKDTLKAGKYALYTKPAKESWEIYFYATTDNWGTPDKWDETKVVLKVSAKVEAIKSTVETFLISFDNLKNSGATICFSWDKTMVCLPFAVATDSKVKANITKAMAGPSANDMNSAASYYLENKMDLKKALEWSTKACESRPDAYWMFLTKAKIQKELGDKSGMIETAKKGLKIAEEKEDKEYATFFQELIK